MVEAASTTEAAETFGRIVGLGAFDIVIKDTTDGRPHVQFNLGTGIRFIAYPESYRRPAVPDGSLEIPLG